ncbi:MAG: hypothetical protein WCH34_00960 [Bacteroidota bacterium]
MNRIKIFFFRTYYDADYSIGIIIRINGIKNRTIFDVKGTINSAERIIRDAVSPFYCL